MEAFASDAAAKMLAFAPAALLFAVLATILKRERIWAALSRTRGETLTNIGLVAINSLILAPLLVLPTERWNDAAAIFPAMAAFWDAQGAALVLPVTLLAGEFVIYWRHRAEHTKWLWPMHAVHHSDTAMTWLALLRKHPLAKVLSLFVDVAPLILLGLPVWAIVVCGLARTWWGYFIHADVPWTLGPLGKWLISPAAHRLHHIDDLELCGSNYGGILTVWDRLFGTYVDPAPFIDCRTGVEGGSKGLAGELARPFAGWAAMARKPAARAAQETAEA